MRVALPERISAEALGRCDPHVPVLSLGGQALGTSWRVRYAARRSIPPERLRAAIEARLAAIVDEMSQWEPRSLLSAFNRAPAGTWLALPPDFAAVVACALDVAERTGGVFDVTVGRAAALLGFGAEAVTGQATPSSLDEAATNAGWRRLTFDPAARRLRQPGGLWLDLSGIGKGFAVDAVADVLRRESIEDALVEIGGELVGCGMKPDGQPWWVDLELPPACPLPMLRVALHDLAVATSGDYVRGARTIDPRIGRPLLRRVRSVSVIHPGAMAADAWATALTVLGPAAGPEMASREALAARMIWQADEVWHEWISPALRTMIDA